MQTNNNNNNQVGAGGCIVIVGIIMIFVGIGMESFKTIAIGFILAFVCAVAGLKKKSSTNNQDIVSGQTRSMPVNNTSISSSESYVGSTDVSPKSYLTGEESSFCPVCHKLSYNGYCNDCGFRFHS